MAHFAESIVATGARARWACGGCDEEVRDYQRWGVHVWPVCDHPCRRSARRARALFDGSAHVDRAAAHRC